MIIGMIPTVALATTTTAPDMSGDVINVTNDNAQDVLDGRYGYINGKTINFTEDITSVLDLARPTKYEGSNTAYYNYTNYKLETEPTAWREGISTVMQPLSRYYRLLSNVTFTSDPGVTVAGFTCLSGHVHDSGYDYVRNVNVTDTKESYYRHSSLSNIKFEGLTITGDVDIQMYQSLCEEHPKNSACITDKLTFDGCTFTGETTSGTMAALHLLSDDHYFTNTAVTNCTISNYYQGIYIQAPADTTTITNNTISNTKHNAIALQVCTTDIKEKDENGDEKVVGIMQHNYVSGTINVSKNYIQEAGDRAIRLGLVGSDATITYNNNIMVNSGDEDGELIKQTTMSYILSRNLPVYDKATGTELSTESITNVSIDLENNYWSGQEVTTAVSQSSMKDYTPTNTGVTSGKWDTSLVTSAYLADGYGLYKDGTVMTSANLAQKEAEDAAAAEAEKAANNGNGNLNNGASNTTTSSKDSSADTGDSTLTLWAAMLAISALGLAGITLYSRRREY
jgi:parallel beta-helix repeat protein